MGAAASARDINNLGPDSFHSVVADSPTTSRGRNDSYDSQGRPGVVRRFSSSFSRFARRFSSSAGNSGEIAKDPRDITPCYCGFNLRNLNEGLIVEEYVEKGKTFERSRKIAAYIRTWWHYPAKKVPRGLPPKPSDASYDWIEPWHVSKWIVYSNPYTHRKDRMRYWIRRAGVDIESDEDDDNDYYNETKLGSRTRSFVAGLTRKRSGRALIRPASAHMLGSLSRGKDEYFTLPETKSGSDDRDCVKAKRSSREMVSSATRKRHSFRFNRGRVLR